ncbi:hypothetical protein NPIL_406061, partial [Nephila pilipes]
VAVNRLRVGRPVLIGSTFLPALKDSFPYDTAVGVSPLKCCLKEKDVNVASVIKETVKKCTTLREPVPTKRKMIGRVISQTTRTHHVLHRNLPTLSQAGDVPTSTCPGRQRQEAGMTQRFNLQRQPASGQR